MVKKHLEEEATSHVVLLFMFNVRSKFKEALIGLLGCSIFELAKIIYLGSFAEVCCIFGPSDFWTCDHCFKCNLSIKGKIL